jgi:hypothetical protein
VARREIRSDQADSHLLVWAASASRSPSAIIDTRNLIIAEASYYFTLGVWELALTLLRGRLVALLETAIFFFADFTFRPSDCALCRMQLLLPRACLREGLCNCVIESLAFCFVALLRWLRLSCEVRVRLRARAGPG